MRSNQWPWSLEEEEQWAEELRRQDYSIVETIEHMVAEGIAISSYDPLQIHEEEEVLP
jgi:hypothetical protein